MTKTMSSHELDGLMIQVRDLMNLLDRTDDPKIVEDIFRDMPQFALTDEPLPFIVDARPNFLGNAASPKWIIDTIEANYPY